MAVDCSNPMHIHFMHIPELQIPSWWVHKAVQPLLKPLNGTEHMDARGGISLFNVVEAQLMTGAHSVWLPKYLLVLFQMTM